MVKILTFVLTVVLFAISALSLAIPPDARHHHHHHHNDDSVAPVDSRPQTLAARDPGLFSVGLKLLKGGAKKAAKSHEGRKAIKGAAKHASNNDNNNNNNNNNNNQKNQANARVLAASQRATGFIKNFLLRFQKKAPRA
ncbi:hypothetical protein BJ912DRAFT_972618 [Pholiota molesta]|nr:hypothetical protein BJ912DRAFT_972618 [Pholiota molesta]